MEIIWYGLSCFSLTERGSASVVTDPYNAGEVGFEPLKLSAEIVTISHSSPGHSCLDVIKGNPYVINGPGEYEIGSVFITGAQTISQNVAGNFRNTLYFFDFHSLTIAHLGDMNRVPTRSEVEAIEPVNIALIPVGGGGGLTASMAAEVISLLEPNIVIPMHYATDGCRIPLDGLDKFLKVMGINEVDRRTSFKVTDGALPEETQVIVLNPQHG